MYQSMRPRRPAPTGTFVGVLDYDAEAARYDESRGGEPRAEAAARALGGLLPATARRVVDVGCGTGIVTGRLRAPGRCVAGTDRSEGMLRHAVARLPGTTVRSDATALPLADASVDAVTMVWLLICSTRTRPGGSSPRRYACSAPAVAW